MKVSTIIPCYNCENYIEETIQSVLNQTYKEVEIICIDNNSTDSTLEIINQLSKIYSSIKVFSEKKPGANYARNKGLERATGEFVQFLDSDDVITVEKYEKQVDCLLKENADLVVSDRIVFDENLKKELKHYEFSAIANNPLNVSISNIIITGNPLYKIAYVNKIGGYQNGLASSQDWEFHIRLFLSEPKVAYLKGTFLHSRTLSNSLSNKDYVSVSNTACEVVKLHKSELIKRKVYLDIEAYKKILFLYLISFIHTKDVDFKNEFLFWYKLNDGKKVFSKFQKLIINSIGINNFLTLKKILN